MVLFSNKSVFLARSNRGTTFGAVYRNAKIIDFVGMIIVWGIITVLQLWPLLCIYLFSNITNVKNHMNAIYILKGYLLLVLKQK